jgi:hypothetical protein
MITPIKLVKDNVNLEQILQIQAFAELGATKKLFELFWAGQYIKVIETAMNQYSHALPFEKSIKIGSTSWITGRSLENTAYLVYAIYKEVAPDNSSFARHITPEELVLVTKVYNIKYHNHSPLIITKVYSVLNGILKGNLTPNKSFVSKLEGISQHQCSCGSTFIARCSTVTASCHWCRSKIKKAPKRGSVKRTNKAINISSISRMTPGS